MYIGPIGYAPTGTPISLVSFAEPDFQRFPRFRDALAAAQMAELGPGDAIYIPALWWHHVESLLRLNILVNYWWRPAGAPQVGVPSALDALLHCLLKFKDLPPEHRAAWGALFEHFVFNESDPAAHIPAQRRGVLGPMTPEQAQQVRDFIVQRLKG